MKYRMQLYRKQKDVIYFVLLFSAFFTCFYLSLPSPLFDDPVCTILEDKTGQLLGARLPADQQWRFPLCKEVPDKFSKAIIEFEDKRFYRHAGYDPVSFLRATIQNIRKGKVVSGGSTISMQVIRLSRKGKSRSVFEKFIEIILAVRLELTHSKREIMALYSANAPFGGNVVGLQAASWRYYNKPPSKLSWSESATLAVLPNSPSLVFPGKNHIILEKKRNRLLKKLHNKAYLDNDALMLAMQEPLPGKPFPLPSLANHLLNRCIREGYGGQRITSTIDINLQEKVSEVVLRHHNKLSANKISNAAALIIEVETGNVLAYVGNVNSGDTLPQGAEVDIINSARSTGSILKPLLYASMLNDGQILPGTLVPDIPMQMGSFNPENSTGEFDGAVPASRALARSLNVPAVWMLQAYGVERFRYVLTKIGMTTLNKSASHYGLSLILGGAEGKLWDVASIYASMARVLNHYRVLNSGYMKADFHRPFYIAEESEAFYEREKSSASKSSLFSASSIWFTFEAMLEVSRPLDESQWKRFASSSKIAWKTGTSFGNRDAWAVGCNPEYVVGVWVGNADGEGRPGLTGLNSAAPLFFDVFKLLNPKSWFLKPYDDMIQIAVCRYSGYPASDICSPRDSIWVPLKSSLVRNCPYHQIIHLDPGGKYRVNEDCEQVSEMLNISWFILPPIVESYYKSKNPFYKVLPPYRYDCTNNTAGLIKNMDLLYPKNKSRIYVPREIDGNIGKVVFKATHRNSKAIIYWQLDGEFIGTTTSFHQIGVSPPSGKHLLSIVDNTGESIIREFEILGNK